MTVDRSEGRSERAFWIGVGGLAPLLAALALVPLRDAMRNANVALVLVAVVVAVAVGGGRGPAAVASVVSTLAFDFFHTTPYLRLRIASSDDVETTALLLVVGLAVGEVAARGRRARSSAQARAGDVRRIHRLAELVAAGRDPAEVIAAARSELRELLGRWSESPLSGGRPPVWRHAPRAKWLVGVGRPPRRQAPNANPTSVLGLRDCRFEAAPFEPSFERVEPSGAVTGRVHRMGGDGFALPSAGAELPVVGGGQVLGRFVLVPAEGTGVTLEQRVVAVALADQVGAALAASSGPRAGGDG